MAAVWGKFCEAVAAVDDPEASLAAGILAGADEVLLGTDLVEIRMSASTMRGSIALGMRPRLERLFLSAEGGVPLIVTSLPAERQPGEEG